MTIHRLNIEKEHFDDLVSGKKTAEVVLDDRNYVFDDLVTFDDECSSTYEIKHIHKGVGIKKGYVMLSVLRVIGL